MSPDSITGITLPDVTTYLGTKGWRRREGFPRHDVLIFDGPLDDRGESIQAVIPAGQSYDDFFARVAELIGTLSIIEDRSPEEIAADMLLPRADRLQVRILSDFAATGSISLRYAPQLIHGLRELVIAAACAERTPRRYYMKATKVGGEYAERCRFGQTQRGSFIVNVECPATWSPEQQQLQLTDVPFGRRVTTRIMQGLAQLNSAVLDGRIDGMVERYKDGLNANMCDALKELQPADAEPKFEFQMNWAQSELAAPPVPSKIQLERRSFDFVDTLSRSLRVEDEKQPKQLRGHIVRLALSEEAGLEKPTLTIRLLDTDDGIQQASLVVDAPTYRSACDAHRDGKEIRVWGRLVRSGRHWRIIESHGFSIIDQKP